MEKVYDKSTQELIETHYVHYVYGNINEYNEHRKDMEYNGYETGRVVMPYTSEGGVKAFYYKETRL